MLLQNTTRRPESGRDGEVQVEPSSRRSLRFGAAAASHAPTRTFSWPRSRRGNAAQGARVPQLCGNGYEFVVTRLTRGLRVLVAKDGVELVPENYGLSLSHLPGDEEVQIDKFNLHLQHRRRGHGTEIMRRLVEWYRGAGSTYFKVTAYTDVGRRFYIKCGFKRNFVGNFVLELKDADKLLSSLGPLDRDPPRDTPKSISSKRASKPVPNDTGVSTRRAAEDTGVSTRRAVECETVNGGDCGVPVHGSVSFQACPEQKGNSCGPHAVRNALLALGNEYASKVDLTLVDVHASWIDDELEAASSAVNDPFSLVSTRVLHIDMLSQLAPATDDMCQHAVDPIMTMLSQIIVDNAQNPPRTPGQSPSKIIVLTTTQEKWDWKGLSHFICIHITWEMSEEPRLDLHIMDSSMNQRKLHGERVLGIAERLRALLVPVMRSLHESSHVEKRLVVGAGQDSEGDGVLLGCQSTTAVREEAHSPSHVGNDGGGAKAPDAKAPADTSDPPEPETADPDGDDGAQADDPPDYGPGGGGHSSDDKMSVCADSVCSSATTVVGSPLNVDSDIEPSLVTDSEDESWLRRGRVDTDPDPDFDSSTEDADSDVSVQTQGVRTSSVRKSAPRQPRSRPRSRRRSISASSSARDSGSVQESTPQALPRVQMYSSSSDIESPGHTSDEPEDQGRTREKAHLRRDFDRLSRSNSKRKRVSNKGAVHASGYRHVNDRLDKRRKGKPSVRKGVKELQEKYPSWTIDEVGGHSTYLRIQEKGQPVTFAISMNRAAKALQVLEYSDCVKALLPDSCKCSKRCYEQVKTTDVLTLRKENFEQNPNEATVTQWLATRLRAASRREDGFPFSVYGHEVCSTFYAKAHGVGRNKALKARQYVIDGATPAPQKCGYASST